MNDHLIDKELVDSSINDFFRYLMLDFLKQDMRDVLKAIKDFYLQWLKAVNYLTQYQM